MEVAWGKCILIYVLTATDDVDFFTISCQKISGSSIEAASWSSLRIDLGSRIRQLCHMTFLRFLKQNSS